MKKELTKNILDFIIGRVCPLSRNIFQNTPKVFFSARLENNLAWLIVYFNYILILIIISIIIK